MQNLSKLLSYSILLSSLAAINQTFANNQANANIINKPPKIILNNIQLRAGDLLFQDLDCGKLCQGIDQVTYGIGNTNISHVAMVVKSDNNKTIVIEATDNGVHETLLSKFLQRSLDNKHRPRVIVERLQSRYQWEIPTAIKFSLQQIGKPYNDSFTPNGYQSFYCSDLIYKSFEIANPKSPIFKLHPMNFISAKTHKITRQWQSYFNQINAPIPQGKLGTNPGVMSRSKALTVIYRYGTLTPVKN